MYNDSYYLNYLLEAIAYQTFARMAYNAVK
jgi:hypothetical protein